jgi:hypothetical protein
MIYLIRGLLVDGNPTYLGNRGAGIRAWFGNDMQTLAEFDLSLPAGL